MTLELYDTMSRKVLPIIGDVIKMYCCGPTVYRDAHVGNLRTFLLSDLIRRTLELNGVKVTLIQNITDVGHMSEDFDDEDKILAASRAEKLDPLDIARKYEAAFHADLTLLNILPAEKYPRASESISLMQEMISRLMVQKNAYVGSDGCVYFDAKSFTGYGQLSGNRLDALKPGHRYEYVDEGGKRFHADWALWKTAGDRHEMIWDSPWGLGFPGWHIECSAMSLHFLGHVNVHVGGIDLRFPHHENERAQSNSITGIESVDHWIHGEHLLFEGRKMSKSSGNVVLVSDVIAQGFDPLAIRLAFLENRYRSQMDLTWPAIAAAHSTLRRWRHLVNEYPETRAQGHDGILQGFNADLDTPHVIQLLRAMEKNSALSQQSKIGAFLLADQVLGLDLSRQEPERALPPKIAKILEERSLARAQKNWQESDRLRDLLEAQGLIIKDSATEQEWEWR
ncbi:MAG TPA: cysteine--tRNA ligase [Candidatus Nanopelagicaceae bacterium]